MSPKPASSFGRGYPGCAMSEDEKGRRETANGDLKWLQEEERRRGKELEGKDSSELDRRGAEQQCSKV